MKEIYVVYFSSTGNTETMAQSVVKGIEEAGAKGVLAEADGFSVSELRDAESFALGCPACGAEELDESVEALMDQVSESLSGKKVGLFGSYGWGDGDWMREWEKRVSDGGAKIVGGEGLIVNGEPDEETLKKCEAMGKKLVG